MLRKRSFYLGRLTLLAALLGLAVSAQGWAWTPSGSGIEQETWPEASFRSLAFVLAAAAVAGILSALVRRRYAWFKRSFDVLGALIGLVLVAPFLALVVLLVRATSRGPAIFTQDRLGKDGRIFQMYKLRTMVQDAEKATGPVWAKADDPRVTPLGRWLRKSHFDEVPQLFNVLKGQMSLIGPRPERPELVKELSHQISGYSKRLQVAPGLTGLAQVWSCYDQSLQDVRRKIKYDLLYIRQMCLTADLGILLRTVYLVSTGQEPAR